MSKDCFDQLCSCEKIIENVGEDEFKSKDYLKQQLADGGPQGNLMRDESSYCVYGLRDDSYVERSNWHWHYDC